MKFLINNEITVQNPDKQIQQYVKDNLIFATANLEKCCT